MSGITFPGKFTYLYVFLRALYSTERQIEMLYIYIVYESIASFASACVQVSRYRDAALNFFF